MAIDVSVVVPVFNTEQYLRECLDSLINQTLKNVELIFVDDGSTDCSFEILHEYQQKDNRIHILHQQNEFAGVARNKGMKIATGKYIIFLDSDDFFELDMLEKAFNCAEENKAQIAFFDFHYYDPVSNKTWSPSFHKTPEGIFSPEQMGEKMFRMDIAAPWTKLYLKSFIDEAGIEFQAVKKNNDIFFTCIALALADRVIHIRDALLYYRINNSSSIQGNSLLSRASFVPGLTELKKEMLIRGRFHVPFRQAYNYYASFSICRNYKLVNKTSPEGLKEYYSSIKRKLIPDIFLTPEDFKDYPFINAINDSNDFETFVFKLLEIEKNKNKELQNHLYYVYDNTISKRSKDYIIGHACLYVPRWIIKFCKKFLNSLKMRDNSEQSK